MTLSPEPVHDLALYPKPCHVLVPNLPCTLNPALP